VLGADDLSQEETWLIIFFPRQMSLGALGFALAHLGFLAFLVVVGALHDRAGDFGTVFPIVILLASTLVAASSITVIVDFHLHHPLFFS
jgi:hypothetical protein